jgi:urease beta subunit
MLRQLMAWSGPRMIATQLALPSYYICRFKPGQEHDFAAVAILGNRSIPMLSCLLVPC